MVVLGGCSTNEKQLEIISPTSLPRPPETGPSVLSLHPQPLEPSPSVLTAFFLRLTHHPWKYSALLRLSLISPNSPKHDIMKKNLLWGRVFQVST
eukprot:1685116-Rhodomonas_salina.4